MTFTGITPFRSETSQFGAASSSESPRILSPETTNPPWRRGKHPHSERASVPFFQALVDDGACRARHGFPRGRRHDVLPAPTLRAPGPFRQPAGAQRLHPGPVTTTPQLDGQNIAWNMLFTNLRPPGSPVIRACVDARRSTRGRHPQARGTPCGVSASSANSTACLSISRLVRPAAPPPARAVFSSAASTSSILVGAFFPANRGFLRGH